MSANFQIGKITMLEEEDIGSMSKVGKAGKLAM